MDGHDGGHDSRVLEHGEIVHLAKPPGRKWRIKKYEWSRVESSDGDIGPHASTVFGERVGWEALEFDTPDDAYAFVADQIRQNRVPHTKSGRPTS